MRIEDNGAGLSPYAIEYAAKYSGLDAMREASEHYRRQGKLSILLGLGSAILGAAVRERGGKHHSDGLNPLGLCLVAGGLAEIINGVRQQGTGNLHKQGARDIIWAVSEGNATIMPENQQT